MNYETILWCNQSWRYPNPYPKLRRYRSDLRKPKRRKRYLFFCLTEPRPPAHKTSLAHISRARERTPPDKHTHTMNCFFAVLSLLAMNSQTCFCFVFTTSSSKQATTTSICLFPQSSRRTISTYAAPLYSLEEEFRQRISMHFYTSCCGSAQWRGG